MNKKLIGQSLLFFISLFMTIQSWAVSLRTTYQARITKPDGQALEAVAVNFRFTILDPTGSCILYIEDYAAVNMLGSSGLISFSLGSGARAYPVSGTASTFAAVFDNSTASYSCQSPGIYTPVSTDNRKIVMQFQDSSGWQTLPAMAINAVPYANYAGKAENSLFLNNKSDTAFVEYSTLAGLSCAADQAIKFNGVSFSCITVGSSSGTATVTSGSVITALGYTPANLSTVNAIAASVTALQNVTVTSASVITALGYTPAQSGSVVSSQWTTSGTTINYMNGYVGIGTSDPLRRLVVRQDNNNTQTNTAFYNADTTNSNAIILSMRTDTTGASATTFKEVAAISAVVTDHNHSSRNTNLNFYTDSAAAGSGPRLTITGLGYVGIGASAPTTALEVAGTVKITGGLPGAGKVLTSDANGLASWQIPSASGSAGALPVASDADEGIVTILAQSFAGIKTFVNQVFMQSSLTVSGTGRFDRIQVSNSADPCNGSTEGSMRYNSVDKYMEFCNGTLWKSITPQLSVQMQFVAQDPTPYFSSGVTKYYYLSYGSTTDSATVDLDAGDISFVGSDTTGCSISQIDSSSSLLRSIVVNGCSGNGPVAISIASGTAKSMSGQDAPGIISYSYIADNLGPAAPTSATWGVPAANLTTLPALAFTDAVDAGVGMVTHDAKVIETVSGNIIQDWNTWFTSGTGFNFFIPLMPGREYTVLLRGRDGFSNVGTPAEIHFTVDGTGPTAPTGLTLGAVPATLLETPAFTFTDCVDVGYAGISYHEMRVIKTSDSSVAKDWSRATSGQWFGVPLELSTQYTVQIRGVDTFENKGAVVSASWTTSASGPQYYQSVAAFQSSNYSSMPWGTPINLSDFNGTTGAGTNAAAEETIGIDLGSAKTVSTVRLGAGVLPSWGGISSYTNGAALEYSTDNVTWNSLTTITGLQDSGSDQFKDYTFGAVSARYLRIKKSGYIAIAEFLAGN